MTEARAREMDTGTAYGMKPATYRAELVEVGPGTPMGELMRRYWQPFFVSEKLKSDMPRRVRLLGEDLILFRDKENKPGLVHEHCCHRGASLFYGRIEEDGIRCCYHGWKFDVKGHCLDQPAEVEGGRTRSRIRQPWYPVEERYGLVYAYMGPPEKKPVLPRWKQFEELGPDEMIEVRWKPAGGAIDTTYGSHEMPSSPYNWLQIFENTTDAPHLPWLHYHHSGNQFAKLDELNMGEAVELPPYAHIKNLAANVVAERSERGIKTGLPVKGPDGQLHVVLNDTMVPNVAVLSGVFDLYYIVPVDDTHFISFMLWRRLKSDPERGTKIDTLHHGKIWWELSPEEHQRHPGDFEAQSSIGAVPAHNREHLSQGDVALAMLRRRLGEAVRDVAEGRDPPNISFDERAPPIDTSYLGIVPYPAEKLQAYKAAE